MIHWLNSIGNTYGGLLAISGILLSIIFYLIPDISLPSWLKLLLVIVMLVSFRKLFVILRDFILSRSKPSIPHGQIFPGIFIHNGGTPADGPRLFDRSQEIEELEKAILYEDAKDHILAVTGVSGVGKSILVEMLVDKLKKEDTNINKITLARFNNPEKSDLSIINDSINFLRQHKDILLQSKKNNSNPYVVILSLSLRGQSKGSSLLLASSSNAAHPIPKLCIRLHLRRDSMTCPTHRSIAPRPKPLRYFL